MVSLRFLVLTAVLTAALPSFSQALCPEEANKSPTAVDDTATAMPGESVVIDVLANDTDPDGDALVIVGFDMDPMKHGVAVVESGNVRYTAPTCWKSVLVLDETGATLRSYYEPISFQYMISDGKGGAAVGIITITGVN